MKFEIEKESRHGQWIWWTYLDGTIIGLPHGTQEEAERYCDNVVKDKKAGSQRWEYKPETEEEYTARHTTMELKDE